MTDAATADLSRLIANLQHAQRSSGKFTQEYLVDTGERIAQRMRALAPVKTGALRNNIRVVSQPGKVTVGPITIPYAAYVEFGTGTRGEFPGQMYEIRPKRANKLVFQINGRWISTDLVRHPGIRAKPYARPAARAVLGEVGADLAKRGAEALRGRK